MDCPILNRVVCFFALLQVMKSISRVLFKKGVGKVKLDRKKYELARARACKGQKELEAEGIPKGTLCRAMSGRGVKPETLGRIAKALGVDVTEILADE